MEVAPVALELYLATAVSFPTITHQAVAECRIW